MGRDKARLPFRAVPLAARVAREVARAAGSAVLVGDPTTYADLGYPVTADLYPGEGPLGGIVTALKHSPARWSLVAACDMPGVTAETLSALFEHAEQESADLVLPAGPSGLVEPLCGVWSRGCLERIEGAFRAGIRKITEAASGLRLAVVPVAEASQFQNVNTPEDWLEYGAG